MLAPTLVLAVALASPPDLSAYMEIRAPKTPVLAEDGTLYVIDWPDGVDQLYRRAAGASLDTPLEQLTEFEDGIEAYWLSPDAETIAIAASIGGGEQQDLFRLDPSDRTVEPLLVDPRVVYRFQCWLRDGSGFIYTANDDRSTDFHIHRYDLRTRTATRLLGRPGAWSVADVTDDGSRLLVGHYASASRADAFELEVETEVMRPLNRGPGSFNRAAGYLPGEDRAAVISDAVGGVRRLYVASLRDGSMVRPDLDLGSWEIEGGVMNPQRSLAAVLFNDGGYRSMRLVRLPSLEIVPLPPIERGVVGAPGIRGSVVTWTLSNARTPGLAWAWDSEGDDPPRPLTIADERGVDLRHFTLPRLVTYRSFDGLEVPAFLYTPPGYERGSSIPFVVHYHGGPEGQHRPRFDRLVQYLLSRGYGVLQPNVRGSTGYGRDYQMLDNYRRRWDSVRDGVEAARWLVSEGYTEPGRIAAYGRSYGGFMAVAAVIEGPDVFGAGVDVVGIVNFRTFLEQTGDYRRRLREVEYGPLTDPEFLASVSPIHRIDDIRVPMLIAHGLNDPRVPVGEAMQLAVELQKRGDDPVLVFFPDEGHRIAKLANRMLFYERMTRFLDATIGK